MTLDENNIQLLGSEHVDKKLLIDKTIAIIGYGNQGHAHALNLRDHGLNVVVGARYENSVSAQKAIEDGFQVLSISSATKQSDIVMMLSPDESMSEVFKSDIAPHMRPKQALMFAHGFNIHFGYITPPSDIDVCLVAPKGPGHQLREEYKAGRGLACLIAVSQNATGKARDIALAYAHAIGGTRIGVFETSFKEETETDLFSEQTILCGGISNIVTAGFETLVEEGYHPVMAYFECLHEVKLIADLMIEKGISGMREAISNTAEFGDYRAGPKLVDDHFKANMKEILKRIQNGNFADDWMKTFHNNPEYMSQQRSQMRKHPIETVGRKLRKIIYNQNI
jgi:ketol-acid reductoisomerase